MFKRTKKGQAILEYIILLTALVAAFFAIKQGVQQRTEGMLNHVVNEADTAVNRIHF